MASVQPDEKYDLVVSDKNPCFAVLGFPSKPIENVTFSNITVTMAGGGKKYQADQINIPELADYICMWPEPQHFKGKIPSSHMFLRHIKNATFENITLRLQSTDERPFIHAQDVSDSEFLRIRVYGDKNTPALFKMLGCHDNDIAKCRIFNSYAPILADNSNADIKKYDYTCRQASEVISQYAYEAPFIDAARCCAVETRYIKNDILKSMDENNARYEFDYLFVPDEHRRYLFIPWALGNIEVSVNGKIAGKRIIPQLYQWRYFWACDVTDTLVNGKNSIIIIMKGCGARLKHNPEIRTDARKANGIEYERVPFCEP